MEIDVRWMQRFQNFQKALIQLEQAVLLGESRELSNLEKQGTIQAFEFTHELAWKTLKDFLQTRGNKIYGSRDATRKAFKNGLIQDGETWMEMIESRSLSSHTYNESVANEIVDKIASSYVTRFAELRTQLERLAENGD